jgi:hypothetical protein
MGPRIATRNESRPGGLRVGNQADPPIASIFQALRN